MTNRDIKKVVIGEGKKMKKFLFIFLLMTFIVGCAESIKLEMIPIVNDINEVSIGDIFFSSSLTKEEPYNPIVQIFPLEKYELTVVELNNEKISLQYNEYTGTHDAREGWLVKQGFNKRFDYSAKDKIIKYKQYEFEILSIDKSVMKYRRIK